MGAEPFALEEVRVRYPGSTFTTAFTNGDHANWAIGTATKLRHVDSKIDRSGLVYPHAPNPSVRTRRRGLEKGIKTVRGGTFTISFFLNSATGAGNDAIKTLLSKVYGGLSTPTASTATVGAGSTTSQIASTGIGAKVEPGAAVLVGTRGDGRGDGEVRVISAEAANTIDVSIAMKAAPNSGDTIWLGHTVYPDPDAAQEYMEFLLIGKDGTSPNQINCVGCQATSVTLRNLEVADEEVGPVVELEISVGDWRWEPAANKATMSTTDVPSGADPAMDKGEGLFLLSDRGTYTGSARAALLGGAMVIEPDITHVKLKDPGAKNGIGGWVRGVGNVKWGFTPYLDEGDDKPVPNLTADHDAETAKQAIYQWGHEKDACVAVDVQNAFIDEIPQEVELEGLAAVSLAGHGDEGSTTTDVLGADHRIHFFHS